MHVPSLKRGATNPPSRNVGQAVKPGPGARQHRNFSTTFESLLIMNKTELIESMAAQAEISKAAAGAALDAAITTITKALTKGDTVTLVGFGSFSVGKRAARVGRNPKTGEEIKIKARKAPKFTPGKGLKDAVN